MKEYKYKEVYDKARMALSAVYVIARDDIRKHWKKMTRQQRCDAMRGLVMIDHVARNPQKYLSRQHTNDAWWERAAQYAEEKKLPAVMYAYYVVPSPELVVVNAAENALTAPFGAAGLRNEFYNLTENIREYDYHLTSSDIGERCLANRYAQNVVNTAERLNDKAEEVKSTLLRRKVLELCHSLKVYGK